MAQQTDLTNYDDVLKSAKDTAPPPRSNVVVHPDDLTNTKPSQVDFFRDSTYLCTLTDSHPSSMNDLWDKAPTTVHIWGQVGATCVFYDDQNFNPDENALLIQLKREASGSNPVEVFLVQNRLGGGDHENGMYSPDQSKPEQLNPDYDWILYKHAKASWVQTSLTIAGTVAEVVGMGATAFGQPWGAAVVVAGTTILKLNESEGSHGQSDNSRVDNLSSVRFGKY